MKGLNENVNSRNNEYNAKLNKLSFAFFNFNKLSKMKYFKI